MIHPTHLWSLVKPRIVALLCLCGASGALAAGGLPALDLAAFLVAGAAIAGGSAALNCWYDRDIDRRMERTADRPLPSGDLSARTALAFAIGLLAVGTVVGIWALPATAVGYMWLGVASYVGLYTIGLKRRHPSGVVLGGSAGSFPVLAGWTATGSAVGPSALLVAGLVFVWTPAHAWALAVVYCEDFATVDVPTLPVVASDRRVRRAIWFSALSTLAVAAAVVPLAGPAYAATLLGAAVPFAWAYRKYHRRGTDPAAVRAFFTSNLFLAVVSVSWAVDGLLGHPTGPVTILPAVLVPSLFVGMWRGRPALRGVRGAPAPAVGAVPAAVYDRIRGSVEAFR